MQSQMLYLYCGRLWGLPRGLANYGIFWYGGTGAWKTGVERVGGRSASATVGVRVGIHDTEGIVTLSTLKKERQVLEVMDFSPLKQPVGTLLPNNSQPLVVPTHVTSE